MRTVNITVYAMKYDVDQTEICMHGDWFYTTDYAIFGHEVKATERSPPDNLTRWIITKSKCFTKNAIKKVSRSAMVYFYLVLSSQVKARSAMAGNSVPTVDAQKAFKEKFNDLTRGDLSIDNENYQRVLDHTLLKVDFSVGVGIYMLRSNLNLNIGKTKGYNNKVLVGNTDMKIGSNRDINRDRKKLTPTDVPKTVISADRHEPAEILIPHNLNMLTKKYNDEKLAITLLIVETGLIAYHFW